MRLDAVGGCCGLAGNFGFDRGAPTRCRWPARSRCCCPRSATPPRSTLVLADGFSCRTQIERTRGVGREAVHLAELLAAAVRQARPESGVEPERAYAGRPARPGRLTRIAADVGAALTITAGAAAIRRSLPWRSPVRRRSTGW